MESCCLKDCYTEKDFKISRLISESENDLGSGYFSLEIVEKSNHKKSSFKKANFSCDATKLDYFDILKGGRTLISGLGGIGKTTLCKKIAYDFYKNNSNPLTERYDDVIWIELGTLNTLPESKLENLMEDDYNGFVKLYFEEKCSSFLTKVSKASSINVDKALFLLDGFDEIQNLIDNCKPLRYLLENIFLTKNVILTSRLHAKLANVFDCVDQELEIVGFTRETVQQALTDRIGNYAGGLNTVNCIDNSLVLTEMMKIPILLDIFLYIRKDIREQNLKQMTMTKLYIGLIKKLFSNYFSLNHNEDYDNKSLKDVIENHVLEEFKHLCDLSIASLENGNCYVSLDHLEYNIKKNLLKTGFLSEDVKMGSSSQGKQFKFVHRTVSEYFAACWVANQSESELKAFVISRKYQPNYQFVFPLLSGLIENGLYDLHGFSGADVTIRYTKNRKLMKFLTYLELGPMDLFRNYHNSLVMDCLKECTIDGSDARVMGANLYEIVPSVTTKVPSKKRNREASRLKIDIYNIGNRFGYDSISTLNDYNLIELCISDNAEKWYPNLLKEFQSTIFEFWTAKIAAELLSNCKEFLKNFSLETFGQKSSIKTTTFSNILRDAYVSKTFLTEAQKSTFLARELLDKTCAKINLLSEILGRHKQSRHPTILDTICNNLDEDIFGVYYYDVLEIFCQLKPSTATSILVGYINSKNLRHLLPFLFENGGILESTIFVENNRLKCQGISSHPLTNEDVLFVHNFPGLIKQDHHCHQTVINTLIDGSTEECQSFFVKHDLLSLQKLGDREFENRKLAKNSKYFKENTEFHKYLSFLYSEGYLRNNVDNLHLTTLYASYYFNPATQFTFGPFHIDLSNSNLDDDNIDVVVQFVVENRHQIHVLILSNNQIGKAGFERLMTEVPRTQLKHLCLDRNAIQFDQCRFELIRQVIRSKNIKTLDLSGNFISKDWIDKLKTNGRNSLASEIDIKFCMLNQCKVIYKRNFQKGLIPALDLFCKKSQKQNITEEIGCFGYATKKNIFDENGNQVLLITEIMTDGQRNLKLSEFYQSSDNSRFLVSSVYVDPYNDCNINGIMRKSLFNRLKDYDIPVYGYFSTDKILKILDNIEKSKSTITEFANGKKSSYGNSVQWANSVMSTESQFIIVERRYPSLTLWKQRLAKNSDVIGMILLLLTTFLNYNAN